MPKVAEYSNFIFIVEILNATLFSYLFLISELKASVKMAFLNIPVAYDASSHTSIDKRSCSVSSKSFENKTHRTRRTFSVNLCTQRFEKKPLKKPRKRSARCILFEQKAQCPRCRYIQVATMYHKVGHPSVPNHVSLHYTAGRDGTVVPETLGF